MLLIAGYKENIVNGLSVTAIMNLMDKTGVSFSELAGAYLSGGMNAVQDTSRYAQHMGNIVDNRIHNTSPEVFNQRKQAINDKHDNWLGEDLGAYRKYLAEKYPKTVINGEVGAGVMTGALSATKQIPKAAAEYFSRKLPFMPTTINTVTRAPHAIAGGTTQMAGERVEQNIDSINKPMVDMSQPTSFNPLIPAAHADSYTLPPPEPMMPEISEADLQQALGLATTPPEPIMPEISEADLQQLIKKHNEHKY